MRYISYLALAIALPASLAADVLVDDLLVGSLSEGWTWREEQTGAWRIGAEGLEMRSMPGNLWAGQKDVRGWLFRSLPALRNGLATEVSVTAEPKSNYEQSGIIWHADDANYVKVMLERFEGKLVANFVREESDQPKIVAMVPLETGSVSIRLAIRDGKYEAQSRTAEASDWVTIGTCAPLAKPPVQVGLGTMQGPKEEQRWVRFQGFRIAAPPAGTP